MSHRHYLEKNPGAYFYFLPFQKNKTKKYSQIKKKVTKNKKKCPTEFYVSVF